MALTKDQIFKADDTKRERVDVPEWANGDPSQAYVYVRTMSYAERESFERNWFAGTRDGSHAPLLYQADLIARTVTDDNGVRIFEATDVPALGAKSAGAIARVYRVAERLNALSAQDVSEKKDSS